MAHAKLTVTWEDDDGEENSLDVPAKWAVCPVCDGDGTTTRHVECDGGGITSSEMAEMEYDDPGFTERYFRGDYDRPCPECKGARLIAEPDEDQIKMLPDAKRAEVEHAIRESEEQAEQHARFEAEAAYERRMGY